MARQLILHEATRAQIERFLISPTQAVLLAGADGSGKGTIADHIVSRLLQLDEKKLISHPYFMRIVPDGNSISIESIRELQKFLQLKTIGEQPLRRALIIEHAQALTTEAQNAYLKLLEEPPDDTIMALTVNSSRALLPTILSRLQTITVHSPTEAQLQAMLQASGKNEANQRQAYFMSGGLPGLLTALINDDEAHPLLASVTIAKEILQKSPFERLSLVDGLSKQKESAAAVLEALDRIAQAGITGAAAKKDSSRLRQWHSLRKHTVAAREELSKSANTKLVLSNLFLHLPG